MPDIDLREAAKALNGWAKGQGYQNFDTYIAAGGSFKFAREDIERRRIRLHLAMCALYRWTPPGQQHAVNPDDPDLEDYQRAIARMADDGLQHAEAQVTGDED